MELELDELNVFQGELKVLTEENYQNFKNDIVELGISSAFDVWRNPEDDKWYILDGHQRKTGLTRMRDEEGYEVPPLPCTVVHARDYREAKKKVLALTSVFGKMTEKGLHGFMVDAGLSIDEIAPLVALPAIDLPSFSQSFFPDSVFVKSYERKVVTNPEKEWDGMPEFQQEDKTPFRSLIVHFADENGAKEFFDLIGQEDKEKTKSIWFPYQEKMETNLKRYQQEDQDVDDGDHYDDDDVEEDEE